MGRHSRRRMYNTLAGIPLRSKTFNFHDGLSVGKGIDRESIEDDGGRRRRRNGTGSSRLKRGYLKQEKRRILQLGRGRAERVRGPINVDDLSRQLIPLLMSAESICSIIEKNK